MIPPSRATSRSRQETKFIPGPNDSRLAVDSIDLILLLAPFGVIDAVDPLLRLDGDAAVLLRVDGLRGPAVLLAALERDGACQLVAGVDE